MDWGLGSKEQGTRYRGVCGGGRGGGTPACWHSCALSIRGHPACWCEAPVTPPAGVRPHCPCPYACLTCWYSWALSVWTEPRMAWHLGRGGVPALLDSKT